MTTKEHSLRYIKTKKETSILTFVAFNIFIGELVHARFGVMLNDFGQNPFRVGCDLTGSKLIGFGSHTGLKFSRRLFEFKQEMC